MYDEKRAPLLTPMRSSCNSASLVPLNIIWKPGNKPRNDSVVDGDNEEDGSKLVDGASVDTTSVVSVDAAFVVDVDVVGESLVVAGSGGTGPVQSPRISSAIDVPLSGLFGLTGKQIISLELHMHL